MKKFIVCLSIIVPFAMTACSDEKTETKKEVIVVPVTPAPAPAPAPEKAKATVTTTPEKNTTIVVDKNGIKVGTPKVDVTINPEKKKN